MRVQSMMKQLSFAAVMLLVGSMSNAQTVVTDYNLDCQPPTRYARVLFAQDVSPDMTNFVNGGLLGVESGIDLFDQWLHMTFEDGVVTGILDYDDKNVNGGSVCAATFWGLSQSPIYPEYITLPIGDGNPGPTRSVFDVLYWASQFDWDAPQVQGRRVVVVFAGGMPTLPPSGLAPFDNTTACEAVDYPTLTEVQTALADSNVHVIFVVPNNLVDQYIGLFGTSAVVPLSTDGVLQFENLFDGFNNLYCDVPVPTQEPLGSTGIFFTDPTTPPPSCTEDAVLQLLHIQDISHSYSNDLANMLNKFPVLMNLLDAHFFSKEMSLASFSDKPVGESGYSIDYCYREDLALTANNSDFMDATETLEILSGRDWRESQYDALLFGATSNTLGWETQDFVNNGDNIVLRVAIVATDAAAHVSGDLSSLLPAAGPTCFDRDYPSPAELGNALESAGVHPIFIVTSDIYWHWKNVWAPQISTDVTVIELSSDVDTLFQVILDALTNICENQRRSMA